MTFQRESIRWPGILACALIAIAILGVTQRASAQVLTNADVVKMVQAKLSETVIINEIKTSTCKFDTSPDALIKLKQAGVSDKVLEAMTEAKSAGGRAPAASSSSKSDANIPLPEDYGIYAVDGAKLYSLIGGNPSDKVPTQPIELYSFETGSPKSYSAATVTSGVAFIVFDQASSDLTHALGLYRLPYGRNLVVTNPDAPLINALGPQRVSAQVSPLQRTLAARLQAFQIPLLSKPISGQPQMVQVAPSSPLAAGGYLFFVARGQQYQFQWIAVGSPQHQAADCVDITFPAGGFGGMMAMNDYWMMHGPPTFPEITPDHYDAALDLESQVVQVQCRKALAQALPLALRRRYPRRSHNRIAEITVNV